MAGNTKALALMEKAQTIKKFLHDNADKIKETLPPGLSTDKMITLVINTMRRNPLIAECSKSSIFNCVILAAQHDLYIDDVLGHAYLIPFKNNKKGGIYEAQLIVGYKGFIHLAFKSEKVKTMRSRLVYENEHFEHQEGTDPYLRHTPLPPDKRGNIIGAYAIAEMVDGTKEFLFMWEADIQKARSRSKAKDSGPWVTDTDAMRMKTTIRRIVKFMDLSSKLNSAVAIDEMSETEKVVGAGYAGGELSVDDFEEEQTGGKPEVEQPQEIPEAETSDYAKSSPEDEAKYSEIVDMTIAMEWSADMIAAIEATIKTKGMDAALERTRGEFAKWQKAQSGEMKTDTTAATGKALK